MNESAIQILKKRITEELATDQTFEKLPRYKSLGFFSRIGARLGFVRTQESHVKKSLLDERRKLATSAEVARVVHPRGFRRQLSTYKFTNRDIQEVITAHKISIEARKKTEEAMEKVDGAWENFSNGTADYQDSRKKIGDDIAATSAFNKKVSAWIEEKMALTKYGSQNYLCLIHLRACLEDEDYEWDEHENDKLLSFQNETQKENHDIGGTAHIQQQLTGPLSSPAMQTQPAHSNTVIAGTETHSRASSPTSVTVDFDSKDGENRSQVYTNNDSHNKKVTKHAEETFKKSQPKPNRMAERPNMKNS